MDGQGSHGKETDGGAPGAGGQVGACTVGQPPQAQPMAAPGSPGTRQTAQVWAGHLSEDMNAEMSTAMVHRAGKGRAGSGGGATRRADGAGVHGASGPPPRAGGTGLPHPQALGAVTVRTAGQQDRRSWVLKGARAPGWPRLSPRGAGRKGRGHPCEAHGRTAETSAVARSTRLWVTVSPPHVSVWPWWVQRAGALLGWHSFPGPAREVAWGKPRSSGLAGPSVPRPGSVAMAARAWVSSA